MTPRCHIWWEEGMNQSSEDGRYSRASIQGMRQAGVRATLMAATALTALAMATPVMAQEVAHPSDSAQQTPGTTDPVQQAAGADEAAPAITVTASRVARQGFDAPTPTTVLNAAEITRRAPNNVSEV